MTATLESAKDYLYGKEIPRLFESVLGGLMHHKPANPVSFLRDCLVQIKGKGGVDNVSWNTFIDQAPPPTSATQIAELKSKWAPLVTQRPALPSITPSAAKHHTRPVICLVGADRGLLTNVASLILRQYDFIVRHVGQETFASDVTACTDTISNWISTVNRTQTFCSGFLLTDYPISRSHLDAFFKKKVAPPNMLLIVHLKTATPVSTTLAACLERARSSSRGVNVLEFDVQSPEDGFEKIAGAVAELFQVHPSPSRVQALSSSGVGSGEVVAIKTDAIQPDQGRKRDLNPSVPLVLLFVGPESKDYVDHIRSALPKVQCFAQEPNDSDEKSHQQLLAALIIAGEDSGVVCVNFPRNETQLQWLLTRVGGVTSAGLVDYSEQSLQDRLEKSSKSSAATNAAAVRSYKEQTIPTIHWIDRSGQLKLICQIENSEEEPAAFKRVEEYISEEIEHKLYF